MTPVEYESVPHRIVTLTWPEASPDDIRALVGAENVNNIGVQEKTMQVRNSDNEWVTLGEGWTVSVLDGHRGVMSPSILTVKYRKVT